MVSHFEIKIGIFGKFLKQHFLPDLFFSEKQFFNLRDFQLLEIPGILVIVVDLTLCCSVTFFIVRIRNQSSNSCLRKRFSKLGLF